jgi:hypothetical protein
MTAARALTLPLLLALALAPAAGCWRTVTDAPPGLPPLVIRIPPGPFSITEPVPIEATWQAGCVKTFYMLQDRVSGDEQLDLHMDSTQENVACKAQRFTASASCVPGPCIVYTGSSGKSRTLSVVFGAPGTHAMTLTIDNGSIRKVWTTDMEVIAPDAIKLTCRGREAGNHVRCDGRHGVDATFEFEAEAYAAGQKIPVAQPALTLDGAPLTQTVLQPGLGFHRVSATYDGLRADLVLEIDSTPPPMVAPPLSSPASPAP